MPDFGSFRGFGDKLVQGQTPTQLGLIGSFDFAIDVDAQLFFDRVSAAGGTLTNTEKTATNQLVLDLKSTSIWSLLGGVYPMVGASSAACSQNLKSSSFTGTFNGGWTFASTGVTGNGTSGYFNTFWDTNNNAAFNNFSIGYYSRSDIAGGIYGSSNPGLNSYLHIYPRTTGNLFFNYMNEGNGTSVPNNDSRGFFQSSIITNSFVGKYRNNNSSASLSPITGNNYDVYFGAGNVAGVASGYDVREISFAYVGSGLTATNLNDFYTAVQTFQTALSRNV